MVNPNDPHSEPDGVAPSDSNPDPGSSDLSSESGPISDELFESLSELLGDTPATDEPVSLPDLESWSGESEQPTAPLSSSTEDLGTMGEDPTLIQMGAEAPSTEGLSALSDSLSDYPNPEGEPADRLRASPAPEASTPIEPIAEDIEDSTLIQAGSPTPSEAAAASMSPELPQVDSPLPDPWADDIESPASVDTAAEERSSEPVIPASEMAEWSDPELGIPPMTEPNPDLAADVPPVAEIPAADAWVDDSPIPEDEPLSVGEDSPVSIDEPFPLDQDSESSPPSVEEPLPIETSAVEESEEVPAPAPSSPEFLGSDTGEASIPSEEEAEPIPLVKSEEAEPTAGMPPVGASSSIPSSSDVIPPSADLSDSASDSEPEIPSAPISEPMAMGMPSTPSSPPGSRSEDSSAEDLGALSDKLPLNRYQAVGLLVALSALGSIIYLGVTGKQQDPSLPGPSPSAPTSSPAPPNSNQSSQQSANEKSGIAVVPPSTKAGASSTDEIADAPRQAPTNRTATVPQRPTDAVGGLDAPNEIPSQLDISDVPQDHWAYPFIVNLHAQGMIPDYPDGKFQPDKPVSRAELAAQIRAT